MSMQRSLESVGRDNDDDAKEDDRDMWMMEMFEGSSRKWNRWNTLWGEVQPVSCTASHLAGKSMRGASLPR